MVVGEEREVMSNAETVLTTIVGIVLVLVVVDVIVRVRQRRLRQRQRAMDRMAEVIVGQMLAGASAAGELVRPESIKCGDEVCWVSSDRKQHEHYVAGFDGDSGPSIEGLHMRPLNVRREK